MANEKNNKTRFDVALSFAGEDREYVRDVAIFLKDYGVNVFYDEFEENELWGRDLFDYLSEIYSKKANYIVMFISKNYLKKPFPKVERAVAQSESFKKEREYILPVRLDNTKIPGPISTIGYIDNTRVKKTPKQLAELIIKKIGYQTKKRWWGKWELESLVQCVSGTLFIDKVDNRGFHFKINIVNGSHTGDVNGQAKFLSDSEAVYKKDGCTLTFLKFNDIIQINEKAPIKCPHGIAASFEGNYHIQKDVFWTMNDIVDDIVLSKIWSVLGKEYWDAFTKCLCNMHKDKDLDNFNSKVIYSYIHGFVSIYEAILILGNNKEVWGAFLDCKDIYYFTSEEEWEEKLPETIKRWQERFSTHSDIISLNKLTEEERKNDIERKQKDEEEIISLHEELDYIMSNNDVNDPETYKKIEAINQKIRKLLE